MQEALFDGAGGDSRAGMSSFEYAAQCADVETGLRMLGSMTSLTP
jgi:hypothetical protein